MSLYEAVYHARGTFFRRIDGVAAHLIQDDGKKTFFPIRRLLSFVRTVFSSSIFRFKGSSIYFGKVVIVQLNPDLGGFVGLKGGSFTADGAEKGGPVCIMHLTNSAQQSTQLSSRL